MEKLFKSILLFVVLLFILYFPFAILSGAFGDLFNLSQEARDSIVALSTPFIIILSILITIIVVTRGSLPETKGKTGTKGKKCPSCSTPFSNKDIFCKNCGYRFYKRARQIEAEQGMKQFKIFVNSGGAIEAVKIGWSWPAFFFNIIWVLVKKMYLWGIVLLAAIIVFGLVLGLVLGFSIQDKQVLDVIINGLATVVAIIFGAFGNRWRETNLQERGFDFKVTLSATTPENAMSLYLKYTDNLDRYNSQ